MWKNRKESKQWCFAIEIIDHVFMICIYSAMTVSYDILSLPVIITII